MATTNFCNESSLQEFKNDDDCPPEQKLESEDIKLYRAILRGGDWETAKDIFNKNKNALTDKLDDVGLTALHIATMRCKNIGFVDKLLKEINPPELLTTMVDINESNALHVAALVGNTKAARMLVDKNKHLLFKKDNDGELPIHTAIINSQRNTFNYMFDVCKCYIQLSKDEGYQNPFEGENGAKLLAFVIREGMIEVACKLMDDYPEIGTITCSGGMSPIECMAEKVNLYYSGTRYTFLQRLLYSHIPSDYSISYNTDMENPEMNPDAGVTKCRSSSFDNVIQWMYIKFWRIALLVPYIKHIEKDKVKHNISATLLKRLCGAVKIKRPCDIPEHSSQATFLAVEKDIPEAATTILTYFPPIMMLQNYEEKLFIKLAIINRNEKVYNSLLHGRGIVNGSILKLVTDNKGLGHFAAKMAPIHKLNLVSGAALQMQRELQWFQEVQKFLRPADREAKNKDNQTPIEVFREEHKELRKEGEEWMKKTTDSYTITAALIITIAFAAAITVPGGVNGNSGKAIFETNPCFIIFVVSDAVSLFTSTTSLSLFLSILTARYSEDDFLYKLLKRLIMGLVMLFLSVASMVVAFSAALFILVGQGKDWILIRYLHWHVFQLLHL